LTDNGNYGLYHWLISDLLPLMTKTPSLLTAGSLASNVHTPTVVTGESLTRELVRSDKTEALLTKKPLDLLQDDLAIQAFSFDNLLSVWSNGDVTGRIFCVQSSLSASQCGGKVDGRRLGFT
jgi:hypothetical protein